MVNENKGLVVFENKKIRRIEYDDEWYYSVVDVVGILTESDDSRKYWNKLSQRLREEGNESVTNCHQLKLAASDGKLYETDCANTKGLFRIIQSIPSPKAEPFKLWLARVGYERVQEINNPELLQNRARAYYELKGYPKEWIDQRMRGIAIRDDLTDEWRTRDVKEGKEFAILTNEITKTTFDKTVGEYKEFKGLNEKNKNQNLRDHMDDWELILTMIGEKAARDITVAKNSQGLNECKTSAKIGGTIARNTRNEIEKETGKSVVTSKNYLNLSGSPPPLLVKEKRKEIQSKGK